MLDKTEKIQILIGTICALIGLLIIAINPNKSALQIAFGSFFLTACVGIFICSDKYIIYIVSTTLFSFGLALTFYNYFTNPQVFEYLSQFVIIGGISWFFMIAGALSAITIFIKKEKDELLFAIEFLIGNILFSTGIMILIFNWGFDSYQIFTGILLFVVGIIFMLATKHSLS